jgi:hypothetical protein
MPVRAPASSSFDWYRVNVRHAASVAPVTTYRRKRAIIGAASNDSKALFDGAQRTGTGTGYR